MSVDLTHKKELADGARVLMGDPAFKDAVLRLRKRWFDQLMATKEHDGIHDLVGLLKALEAIPTELQTIVNDYIMAARRNG